jgi:hypothetical protein
MCDNIHLKKILNILYVKILTKRQNYFILKYVRLCRTYTDVVRKFDRPLTKLYNT